MPEIVVIIRPSFKKICDGDTCRAALFNHLLYWIARKVKGEKRNAIPIDEIHWYGTAEEIYTGIDCAWSINKVRKEIKELVDADLIGQCHNPVNGWDQTRHYFLGEKQGRAIRAACKKHGICLRHLGLAPDILHLLNKVNAFGNCNCQISEIDSPNQVIPTTKYGSAIPKNDTKITSKNSSKEEEGSHASSPHPLWSLWRKSIGRKSDQPPNERDLNYCHELTWICQQAQVELTIAIIHAVRDQFKQTNKDKPGWFLGNLVTELTSYLDQLPLAQPEEMSELTEEEAEQPVLWSRHPSKIITMMGRGENTIEDHWKELVWMSHSEAREYGYDAPLARRYTSEEIEHYKQLTSQQAAYIAQKATSYEPTHHSRTANALESTR